MRTTLIVAAIVAIFALGFLLVGSAAQVLLLLFAGVLFGTSLRGLAEWVARKLGWRVGVSLAACLGLLLVFAVALAFWIVPNVADQMSTLASRLSDAYEELRRSWSRSGLGQRLSGATGGVGQQIGKLATRTAGVLASTVGAIGSMLLVVFIALYLAGSPEPYRRGFVRLFPPRHRDRAGDALSALSSTLRRWLVGRIVSMAAVGVVTTLGLWALGIPLPVTLGLIAGLFGFVPNIGPILSAVPAVLLALTIDPMHAVYVVALYLAVNLADGYLLTPWVQKRAVSLPPALILSAQVLLGALAGLLGVVFATPLAACALVLVRELYVDAVIEGDEHRARAGDEHRLRTEDDERPQVEQHPPMHD